MRIAIKGTSGAGKTTLARRIAKHLGIAHVELDALNWGPGWLDRSLADPAEFRRRVAGATASDEWVSCGSYSQVDDLVWARASLMIWLDFGFWRVMVQVVRRSVRRTLTGEELWPGTGNRESLARWMDSEHPVRWVWNTWARRRDECASLVSAGRYAPLDVVRVREPKEIPALMDRLVRERVQSRDGTESVRLQGVFTPGDRSGQVKERR